MISIEKLLNKIIIHPDQGYALYYYENGEVYEKCNGKLKNNDSDNITFNTNFRLASVSKQFIAYAIVDLIHKNKLSYETNILSIYPTLPNYFKDITIKHLLSHNSGIYNYEEIPHNEESNQVLDRDILTFLKNTDNTYFKPGTTYKYSNTAYVLLGLIIEDVSGESISDYIKNNIFIPANMNDSYVNIEGTTKINNRAYGHIINEDNELIVKDQSFTSATIGDGGLYSSINDLKKWCIFLNNSPYYKEMKKANYLNVDSYNEYGIGMRNIKFYDREIIYHCGDTIGTNTLLLHSKNFNICLIFLTNIDNIDTSIIKDNLVTYLKEKYSMKNKLLYLAKRYDLVVGDTFELFYRGVIKSMNPYKYYIHVTCEKGKPYPRYYTYTPGENDEGDYPLVITLYDDYHNVIDRAVTMLHVVKPEAPSKKVNILCFGDSLTFNGVWPYEGYRRFTKDDGEPIGLGFKDSINLIGTMKKDEVGYEGYGGWQWRHFVKNEAVSTTSSVWIEVEEHHLDENDQHSVWKSNNLNWVLESIEDKKLKFKRGVGNYSCLPKIGEKFVNVEGGIHTEDIDVSKYYFEKGNPFYDESLDGPNFKKYCIDNNFEGIDYVYILLTWNGQYLPFNENFSHYEPYILSILNQLKKDYPNVLVRLIGIQSPSINGGIASNYGANGPYSDVFGEVATAYNYSVYLERLCERDEYKSYCRYIDMKAQFDVENNMPSSDMQVNVRNKKTEKVGTNGVHPTMEGYLQIGDVFYRALVSDMKEISKK